MNGQTAPPSPPTSEGVTLDKLNPSLLLAIIFVGVGFIWLCWRLWRPETPKCTCGASGRLVNRQETGQRAILTYHCGAGCGGVWEVTDRSFEQRRVDSYN